MKNREFEKIAWSCRRGLKELDRMLEAYRQRELHVADAAERQTFIRLLEFPDPVLAGWLLAREEPAPDVLLGKLIAKIRGCVDVEA